MTDIKIKRCADKENLKKLVRYIKATFANKSEVNEEFYTKEQIDTMLESGSGGTGGGSTSGDYYTKSEIDTKLTSKANSSDVYNKSETDTLLSDLAKTSDLATVATTGSYNDLLDKPASFDVDLGNYYTKSEVDNLLSNTGSGADSATGAAFISSNSDDFHEIRFDWSRQVPDFVGVRVDETDMGGIVTTDNIRAQWYAAYPDGAAAHNAMWGGRDITAAFNSGEFSEHVADGTFRNIFPGDYITKQVTIPKVRADDGTTLFAGDTYTINWVITDCDYWNITDSHVVIVPSINIFNARMNPTNTTEGGYAGSEMFKKIIPACVTGIVKAFGSDHILTFRDVISNSVDTSHVSSGIPQWTGTPEWDSPEWGNAWADVQCNLMSENMVYGAPICSGGAMDNVMAIRQMSAFRLSSNMINDTISGRTWWLRDVVSSSSFAAVYGYPGIGVWATAFGASMTDASIINYPGVRPFALLR